MSIHTSSEVEYVIPFSAKDHKKQKDILPYYWGLLEYVSKFSNT